MKKIKQKLRKSLEKFEEKFDDWLEDDGFEQARSREQQDRLKSKSKSGVDKAKARRKRANDGDEQTSSHKSASSTKKAAPPKVPTDATHLKEAYSVEIERAAALLIDGAEVPMSERRDSPLLATADIVLQDILCNLDLTSLAATRLTCKTLRYMTIIDDSVWRAQLRRYIPSARDTDPLVKELVARVGGFRALLTLAYQRRHVETLTFRLPNPLAGADGLGECNGKLLVPYTRTQPLYEWLRLLEMLFHRRILGSDTERAHIVFSVAGPNGMKPTMHRCDAMPVGEFLKICLAESDPVDDDDEIVYVHWVTQAAYADEAGWRQVKAVNLDNPWWWTPALLDRLLSDEEIASVVENAADAAKGGAKKDGSKKHKKKRKKSAEN